MDFENSRVRRQDRLIGKKLRAIAKNNRVSFCVVGETKVLPARFTTEYNSIILDCTAYTGLPAADRHNALKLLIEKYSPDLLEKGLEYAEKSFDRTEIIRLDIEKWSGKRKSAGSTKNPTID